MKLHFLGYRIVLLLTIVGVTQATQELKILRKTESGLSVGGVSLGNTTAKSKRHCSMGFVFCVVSIIDN